MGDESPCHSLCHQVDSHCLEEIVCGKKKIPPVFRGMASYFPKFLSSRHQNELRGLPRLRLGMPYHGKLEELVNFI